MFEFTFITAERNALPAHSYLKQLLDKRFPPIPPRDDAEAEHAEAILASAEGKSATI